MSSYLVLTASGRDRPGVVDGVTQKIATHEGNIEMSRMARLGGEFAMLALINIPEEKIPGLEETLDGLEKEGLIARVRRTNRGVEDPHEGVNAYQLRVSGADHPGIVHKVAHALATRNVNIETVDSKVSEAPWTGAPLFTMNSLVFAPDGVTLEELDELLEAVGDELAVDIEIGPNLDD